MKLHESLLRVFHDCNMTIDWLPKNKKFWNQFIKQVNLLFFTSENECSALTGLNNKLREDLKTIERIAHLGFWSLDLKTNQRILSKEIYSLLGRDDIKEIKNQHEVLKLVHPKDRDNYATLIMRPQQNLENMKQKSDFCTGMGNIDGFTLLGNQ